MNLASLLFRRKPEIRDFPGGIHPPEKKDLSNQVPIRPGPIPETLILPLSMHIGAPAKPLVEIGDTVLRGQKIAEATGPVSVPLHAPSSGKVVAIGPRPVQHPSGLDAPCIVIETDGRHEAVAFHPIRDWRERPASELVPFIREAGIAGMGGAGFPTAIKVNIQHKHRVEQLIINAVECEPYITADDLLMRERAPAIIDGVRILQHLLQPDETLIGIEDNKPEAIAAMRRAAKGTDIRIISVPTKYPSGGEKQLIQLLTGKEVPSGGLPAEVGVVCHNTGTAWAIHRAIEFGEPLTSRITTLTGEALAEPGNYEVLIGTPVADLLKHAGADTNHLGRLVMGGPMMGFTLHTPAIPVVKVSNCIIAATPEEMPPPPPEQPCIRCGACAEVCPANLLPQQLYWYSKAGELEQAQHYNLMDCIECGACAWVCPSNIPLVQYYRYAKGEVRNQIAEQQKADHARQRFEARMARIEKEKADKEARRQARLEANRQKKTPDTQTGGNSNLEALKKASLEASSAWKAAVKEAKTAEAEGAENAAELRARADELKTVADQAKAAVRDAKATGSAPPASSVDRVGELKKQVAEASANWKAAVKAAKQAEADDAGNASELRAEADQLKSVADKLKAELRDAKAATPANNAAPPAPAKANPAADPAAERAQKMKTLKAAYNSANKQFKEAGAALERAERDGSETLEQQRQQVATLKARADQAKAELNALVEEAKADISKSQGADLKTLKLEAGQALLAVRNQKRDIDKAREQGDPQTVSELEAQLATLQEKADQAAARIKQATEQGGLSE